MRFAIDLAIHGLYADPRLLAELAQEAEDFGWDGFFLWDHIQVAWPDPLPVTDPWIALAAIATATRRIRLGPMVTAVPRRHPWKLARECVALDHLSAGRLILGIGLGVDVFGELSTFATPLDDRTRAEMLDEGLEIVVGLWSGQPFEFSGRHYQVKRTAFLPAPVQSPRIPIWVAGTLGRKRPFRRAARYDGVVPMADINTSLTPDNIREIIAYLRDHRSSASPFEVVQAGVTAGDSGDAAIVAPFAEAGATWWFESPPPWQYSPGQVRDRIRKGPPRLD
jgi:alkanesulfonate monooxygenase SsuD/methylene tetrahydromethanopterin reductase-like flavin-dependent oxidoreductase (luciferase family)